MIGRLLLALLALSGGASQDRPPLKALIVDGQSNHVDWPLQTRMLLAYLEQTKLFSVEVATSPPRRADMSGFRPRFSNYDVVLSVYNGDPWPERTKTEFAEYVRAGGGFVPVHAADNPFPDWKEYNEIIGLGGWYRRDERSGPWVYFDGEKIVRNTGKGRGGSHGVEHRFPVATRNAEHPVTKGIPPLWMHERDELYDRLRGPAENLTVLATAWSDPGTGGSGRHEPMLMTIRYGKGRVFHTTLGHGAYSRECVGFIVTLQRGTEWAATGKVTLPVPDDFPTAEKVSIRSFSRHQGPALCLAFSPNGLTVASGGEDGTLRFWDGETGAPSKTIQAHAEPVTSIAWSRKVLRLATGGRRTVEWNLATRERVRELGGDWPESVAYSADGAVLASAGRRISLWKKDTDSPVVLSKSFARDLAFGANGLAAACSDSTVRAWKDLSDPKPIVLRGHRDSVDAVAWTGSHIVASGGRDGEVRIWNLETGECVRTIQPRAGWINDLKFSPDGKILAVGHSRLTLWDVETGTRRATLGAAKRRVFGVAFSADGGRIAGIGDDPLRIWKLSEVLK